MKILQKFPEDTYYHTVEGDENHHYIRAVVICDELYSFPLFNTALINIINDKQQYDEGTSNRIELHDPRRVRVEDVQ